MRAIIAAVALVLGANVIALIHAARNRGTVTGEVELNQRQVWVMGASRNRSSMSLGILAARNRPSWEPGRLEREEFIAWRVGDKGLVALAEDSSIERLRERYAGALITHDNIGMIRIPAHLRRIFEPVPLAHFRVRIRFGANYEPWIVSAERTD